jgi:sugar/nucleoside kinase (ribokinase family)
VNLYDCVVIGDVLIDIILQVDGNDKRFFRGGTSYSSSATVSVGGGGNVAVGLSQIGGKSAFIGKAGCDLFGDLYDQDLKVNNVASRLFRDKRLSTGFTVVFVENLQRSFLVFRGANNQLLSEEIDEARRVIENSQFVYFSGFSLVSDPQRNSILGAVNQAKRLGKKIVFDPGAYNLAKSEAKLFDDILNKCDVFSPNLEEARAITKTDDMDELVRKLQERVPLTLLKCDKNGSVLITKDEIVRIHASHIKCVDPTGAGDAFIAGALYGLSRRLPMKSIGQLANWFSAEVVSQQGPRSFPTKSRIVRFLKRLPTD